MLLRHKNGEFYMYSSMISFEGLYPKIEHSQDETFGFVY